MNVSEDRTLALGKDKIGSLLWLYAWPAVLSQIISSIYNIADRVFIGQGVGALAISGLAITMPVMNIIHAFGSLVGAGAGARMSIVLGKKDVNWAENILGNAMLLTFFFGFIFVAGGYFFMDDILTLFGATPETISYAREYLMIVLPGMFLTTLTYNLVSLMRSSGYPKRSMAILVSGAILNLILDPIFIFVLKAGISGAAWATTISMALTAVFSVLHFVSRKSFIRFRRHSWKPRLYIFRNIIMIGMSPFLMNVAASAVVALLNSQLIKYGGDLAVGAYGICNTYGSFLVMGILGICQGMQPIAGYNYGAGLSARLKDVYTLTLKLNVAVGTVGAILGVAIPRLLSRAFTSDAELVAISSAAFPYLLVMFPLIGFTITNSNFFQSIDKPWIAIVTSLSRQVIFLAPMSVLIPMLFVKAGWNSLSGVWISCTISDVLGAILAGALLLTQLKVFRTR